MQRIIDFRCRPPFGNFTRDWIFELDDKPGNPGLRSKFSRMGMKLPPSLLKKSMETFFQENEVCGIVHSVVPLRKLPTLANDDLVSLLQAWPGLFSGFAGIQPVEDGIPTCLDTIRNFVFNGPCTGIYMEPGLDPQPWLVDDERFFPIFEMCQQQDIPICMLYGGVFHRPDTPDYEIYSPSRIERIARTFPRMRIALSHACWPFTAHACAVALNYENVWLSPDGFMIDHPGAQDYVVAANYRLQDKIIFGSLYPSVPTGFAVEKYKALLKPEVWDKVFFKNALAFLKRNEKDLARN